jgi:hypothetical protein
MAMVRDWFGDFMAALIQRTGRTDFPEIGTEYWTDFERNLVEIGALWPHADRAISLLCECPKVYLDNVRPLIVASIKKLYAQDQAGGPAAPGSAEAARLASRDCPDCLGSGGAPRFVHAEIHGKVKTFGGRVAPIGARVIYPCSCPMGRVMALGLRQPGQQGIPLCVDQYPSLRRLPVEWARCLDGLDCQYRYNPDEWNTLDGRPLPLEFEIETVEDLRRLIASGKAVRRLARVPHEARSIDETFPPEVASLWRTGDSRPGSSEPTQPSNFDPGPLPEEQPGWF